jgi:hypothetical protein
MHQEPEIKRPPAIASGRSFSEETWFRSFSSAHRAQPLQAPWRLPARLPDPVVTDRITPDAVDIFPDFQQMSNFFANLSEGRTAVHRNQKPGADWRGDTAVAGTAGVSPNAIYFFIRHTESGVQRLSSVGMAVGKPRTDPEFSKIVRCRTVLSVNASACGLFNTPDLSKKAGPQKSKWH